MKLAQPLLFKQPFGIRRIIRAKCLIQIADLFAQARITERLPIKHVSCFMKERDQIRFQFQPAFLRSQLGQIQINLLLGWHIVCRSSLISKVALNHVRISVPELQLVIIQLAELVQNRLAVLFADTLRPRKRANLGKNLFAPPAGCS